MRAVRPVAATETKPVDRYGLVVIGGGPAGLVAALGAAGLGVRVALVERGLLGGDCLNSGCVPSKAFLAAGGDAAHALRAARRVRADLAVHDSAERLHAAGVDVYAGDARFLTADSVDVGGTTLRFARCVLATGSRARRPPWMARAPTRLLTHEGFFELRGPLLSVVVVGGGVVGCELAQGLARVGVATTLLHRGGLLEREDPDAAAVVARGLVAEGVVLRQGEVVDAEEVEDGVVLRLSDGESLRAAYGLVAVGREVVLDALNLGVAGVDVREGRLVLDAYLRTTNAAVFAAGDVAGGLPSTHAADAMARLVLQNALLFPTARWDASAVPRTVLTAPELASFGPTRGGAGQLAVEVGYDALDRQRCVGKPDGFARVWVDRRGRIVGATVVGEGAGDVIAALLVAASNGVSLGRLSTLILPYPTRGEVLRKLGDAWRRSRLTARLGRWIRRWLALRLGPGSVRP